MNNPMEMIQAFKNPKQYVMNYMQNNSNPMFNNLISMANKNDIEGLKNFGRNLYKQQNRNFDEELSNIENFLNGNK